MTSVGCMPPGQQRAASNRAVAVLVDDAVEDEHERPGRLGSAQVLGEGRLSLQDEAVGLRRVQPALDGHDPVGWDVAGLDAEHVVASLSQGGLDVADQQLVVAVPAVEFAEQRVQPVRALAGLNGDIPQDKLDVGQAQARTTEQADELPDADLGRTVAAVPGGLVCRHGPQEPAAVVDPQRPGCQAGPPRELTDRDKPGSEIILTGPIFMHDPRARSTTRR